MSVWTRSEKIGYNPEAIPAAAMGSHSDSVTMGLDLLNVYLHEAARWMEDRAVNLPADTTKLVDLGKKLGDLARQMGTQTEPKMAELVEMASMASSHSTSLKAASTALTSSDEYQMAMTDYLALLTQYQAFHSGK